jgi:hypothetical protein
MKNPKFFTIEEAENVIGLLETTLERIKRNKQQFLWLQEEISILELIVDCGAHEDSTDAKSLASKVKTFKKLSREIERDVRAIDELGCVLRDVDSGIVDFFSVQDGTVVFLCWRKGEESIKYWHPLRDGFGGRQELERSPSKR